MIQHFITFAHTESYFEVDLVNKLETVIEKQRGQIKRLDRSVLDFQTENDELRCQTDKMSACTRDLRRKLRSTQSQLHSLVDERADLTAKVLFCDPSLLLGKTERLAFSRIPHGAPKESLDYVMLVCYQ